MTFKEWYKGSGKSLRAVAKESGVPKTTVIRFLNGENMVSARRLRQLAKITDGSVSLGEIVDEMSRRVAAIQGQ